MPRSPFTRRRCQVSVALVALLSVATLSAATPLQWPPQTTDYGDYGYLWQYSIPPSLGAEACGPTSTTNAFTFLQNTQGDRIGNQLTGSNYDAWLANAQILAANDYMDTGGFGSSHPGTLPFNLAKGMVQYAQHWHTQNPDRAKIQFDGVVPLLPPVATDPSYYPPWVERPPQGPTIEQLYGMLAGGAGVVMGMIQQDASTHQILSGHIVTLAGMEWNDNGDGIMDQGEATLSIIDPLDPSSYYGNTDPHPYGVDQLYPQKAAPTTLDVWHAAFVDPESPENTIPALAIDYWQYKGSEFDLSGGQYGPYEPEKYEKITANGMPPYYVAYAFGMRAVPVPEPTSVLLWSTLFLGVSWTRRRRA
ncbi:MAG: hypothetical protein ABGY24_00540 [bacterium]